LATAADGERFVAADLDLAAQERIREALPSLANRRPEAYAWPQLVDSEPERSERAYLIRREWSAGEVLVGVA